MTLAGRDKAGEFMTKAAKEYPALMCKAVARAVRDRIMQCMVSGEFEPMNSNPFEDPVMASTFVPRDPYCSIAIGADCMLHNQYRD